MSSIKNFSSLDKTKAKMGPRCARGRGDRCWFSSARWFCACAAIISLWKAPITAESIRKGFGHTFHGAARHSRPGWGVRTDPFGPREHSALSRLIHTDHELRCRCCFGAVGDAGCRLAAAAFLQGLSQQGSKDGQTRRQAAHQVLWTPPGRPAQKSPQGETKYFHFNYSCEVILPFGSVQFVASINHAVHSEKLLNFCKTFTIKSSSAQIKNVPWYHLMTISFRIGQFLRWFFFNKFRILFVLILFKTIGDKFVKILYFGGEL